MNKGLDVYWNKGISIKKRKEKKKKEKKGITIAIGKSICEQSKNFPIIARFGSLNRFPIKALFMIFAWLLSYNFPMANQSIQREYITHFGWVRIKYGILMTATMNKNNKLNRSTYCLAFRSVVSLVEVYFSPSPRIHRRNSKASVSLTFYKVTCISDNRDKHQKVHSLVENWWYSWMPSSPVRNKLLWRF